MIHKKLEGINACEPGLEFASNYETLREAWDNCLRGDWMCWYAKKAGVDKRTMILVAGLCAETVIHLMTDERSVAGAKASIAYGKGEISDDELYAAAWAAMLAASSDAAWAAAWADASDAAWAASAAARAAAAAAMSAADEARSAAARSAAWPAAAAANQKQTAEICRKYLTDKIKW